MIKGIRRTAVAVAAVGSVLAGGVAVGATVFDPSTPPPSPHWMTRPCKTNLTDIARPRNCYWNSTMGLTQSDGTTYQGGFWIRKIPGEPVVCYLYAPNTYGQRDACYPTTESHKRFAAKMYGAFTP